MGENKVKLLRGRKQSQVSTCGKKSSCYVRENKVKKLVHVENKVKVLRGGKQIQVVRCGEQVVAWGKQSQDDTWGKQSQVVTWEKTKSS